MRRVRCTPSEPLDGVLDLDREASLMPDGYVVKGMFFKRLVGMLGEGGWNELAPRLWEPPPKGRYVAFKDYPQHDHLLVNGAVAHRRYRSLGLREALRRLARDDVRTFAESTFGGVMLSLVRDARSALHKVPAVYAKVAPGDWTITADDLGDRTVRLSFEGYRGDWSYTLGQLEGVVLHYGGAPVTTVEEGGPGHVRFEVTAQ